MVYYYIKVAMLLGLAKNQGFYLKNPAQWFFFEGGGGWVLGVRKTSNIVHLKVIR